VAEILLDRGLQVVALREALTLHHEDVGDVHAGRTSHFLHARDHDEERVYQHGERDRDLHVDEHGPGAVAQQRRDDRTDVKIHDGSPYWLLRYTAGGSRPTRQAGYRPAASVAVTASRIAHITPMRSKCISSW